MFTPETNMALPRIWERLSVLMFVSFVQGLINSSHLASFVQTLTCGSAPLAWEVALSKNYDKELFSVRFCPTSKSYTKVINSAGERTWHVHENCL